MVSVADGDTVTILDDTNTQHKIRLSGIDAPEEKQPFGQRSKQSLSDLVFAKGVTVETNKRDKYKRNVGKVLVDGVDANLVQVQRGFAWHYKAYEREQPAIDRKVYAELKMRPESLDVVYGPMWSLCRLGTSGIKRPTQVSDDFVGEPTTMARPWL